MSQVVATKETRSMLRVVEWEYNVLTLQMWKSDMLEHRNNETSEQQAQTDLVIDAIDTQIMHINAPMGAQA